MQKGRKRHWGDGAVAGAAFWLSAEMADRAVQQFEHSLDELAAGWATVCEFSLARADEARQLMMSL